MFYVGKKLIDAIIGLYFFDDPWATFPILTIKSAVLYYLNIAACHLDHIDLGNLTKRVIVGIVIMIFFHGLMMILRKYTATPIPVND